MLAPDFSPQRGVDPEMDRSREPATSVATTKSAGMPSGQVVLHGEPTIIA
jgi:hypothetical protein